MSDIINIIKGALPKGSAQYAEAIYSFGLNRKSEALISILREHKRGDSQRLKDEVMKLAQAQKDARPAAAPKAQGAKAKARADKAFAFEAKAAGDGFETVTRKRVKQKYLWEREVCDAANVLQFSDHRPAPRMYTFADGDKGGYQVMSAGKLVEAMTRYIVKELDDVPFAVITPAARAFNTPIDQWRVWVKKFDIKEVKLFFLDSTDASAAPTEEKCYVAQFGNEHVCVRQQAKATKATGDTAEYQVLSVQLPAHHFPGISEDKLKSQFSDLALRAVGSANVYKGSVPKFTGVITTSFKDQPVRVIQGLVSVHNDRIPQTFRRSGIEGVLIRTFRIRDPYQVVLLPTDKGHKLARETAHGCGDDSFGLVMTQRGYAIRVTADTRSRVEAEIDTEVAELLGDTFHELRSENPECWNMLSMVCTPE